MTRRGRAFAGGHPLVGIRSQDLTDAGVRRVGRVTGVIGGHPVVEDRGGLEIDSVVWSTGARPDHQWIKLPVFEDGGRPRHRRGVAEGEPNLCFVGLPFQSSLVSDLVGGVGSDARYVVEELAARLHRPGGGP